MLATFRAARLVVKRDSDIKDVANVIRAPYDSVKTAIVEDKAFAREDDQELVGLGFQREIVVDMEAALRAECREKCLVSRMHAKATGSAAGSGGGEASVITTFSAHFASLLSSLAPSTPMHPCM